jgi:hypothetical protein
MYSYVIEITIKKFMLLTYTMSVKRLFSHFISVFSFPIKVSCIFIVTG